MALNLVGYNTQRGEKVYITYTINPSVGDMRSVCVWGGGEGVVKAGGVGVSCCCKRTKICQ